MGMTTGLLVQAKANDPIALEQLFAHLHDELLHKAIRKFGFLRPRIAGPDDALSEAFEKLRQEIDKELPAKSVREVSNGVEIRALLLKMTRHQLIAHLRKDEAAFRGGNKTAVSLDSAPPQNATQQATPEEDLAQEFLAQLPDDTCRRIAHMTLAGYTHQEIAREVGKSVSTVERKLSGVIRPLLEKYLT